MIQKDRLVQTFLELAAIHGESKQEKNVARYLEKTFTDLGLSVQYDDTKEKIGGDTSNMFLKIPGTLSRPPVMVSAHMDTVVTGGVVEPVIDGEYIRSRGNTILGADDRAGLAQIIEAVRILQENNLSHPPVFIIITVAEEIGLLGARNCDISEKNAAMGVVLDTTGPMGKIVYQAPWHDAWTVKIRGKSAHAGIDPEAGSNAIARSAGLIEKIPTGRLDSETTANIARIRGGTADNIVPEEVRLKGEIRSISPEKVAQFHRQMQHWCADLEKRDSLPCTYSFHREYEGYTLERSGALIGRLQRAVSSCGITPKTVSTGGGSDANFFNARGIPTAVISCGMDKVHTSEEQILIQDLYDTARILLSFILGE
ncbi:MAG: M20/M25/M40 family metallo-hydrolase [Fibrobacterota bacterium]